MTTRGAGPHYLKPFAEWCRIKQAQIPNEDMLLKMLETSRATLYRWAAGTSLPSGARNAKAIELFSKETGKVPC